MKTIAPFAATTALVLTAGLAHAADLTYDFPTDVQGFANVSWQATAPTGWAGLPGAVKTAHTVGGWQMQLMKEFNFEAGGGAPDQQVAMQQLAHLGPDARFKFDIMVDGGSFPAGAQTWYQLNVVGNSDGTVAWTQNGITFPAGWHNADDATLLSAHVDQPFSSFGWQPGDNWFQLHVGSNSEGAVPVNFYLDNVVAYAVPEPGTLAIFGLGALAGLLLRRRQ